MDSVDVLRIITRLNIGGPARHALLLDSELPRRGLSARLIYGNESPREGRIPPDDDAIFVPTLRRELAPVDDVRSYRSIASLIGRFRPTIVHTHMAKAGTLGRIAARRAGVPVIIHTFHGHVLDEYFSRITTATFAAVERKLAKRTTRLVAVSNHVRDSLLERGIGTPAQWDVIPLGLDLAALSGDLPSQAEARAALGFPQAGPLIGIVGRLAPIKDHATFLRAANLVRERYPSARFVIAGDGPLRPSLEKEASVTLGDAVVFTGWQSDLPTLYASLDVVVLTSLNEGTPVALIEAGAAGRPVVATDVGGVASVVLDGETGWLCVARDAACIADRIGDLLSDEVRAQGMGTAARDHVIKRFGADRLADDIVDLYRAAIRDCTH